MKCPIFQIIRDFLIVQPEFKAKCFLNETHATEEVKKYYKILLPESRESLVINNEILIRCEHHVSVYEDQTWSEKYYQSAYHYTGIFNSGLSKYIIHVYFDANGQFKYIHVKDSTGKRIDNFRDNDEKNIRYYAESASMTIISLIQSKAAEISQNFEKEFKQDVTKLENISKKLSQETIEVLNKYKLQLEVCLQHFEKLRMYTYSPCANLQNRFVEIHKAISSKISNLQQGKVQQLLEKLESENQIEFTHDENINIFAKKESDQKLEKRQEELRIIEEQLKKLTEMSNFVDRLIKEHELLNLKITLCDQGDLDGLVYLSSRLNKLEFLLQTQMPVFIMKGDLITVKKLVNYVNFIPPLFYFECVKNGYKDLMIHLIKYYKFNINTINIIWLAGLMPGDILGKTLLLTAVEHEQFEIFKWLLENGANPNIANILTGAKPLMHTVLKALYHYAELLLLFKANPNQRCFTQKIALLSDDLSLAQNVARASDKCHTGNTALHLACECRKTDFIRLLLNNNANPCQLNLKKIPPFLHLTLHELQPLDCVATGYFIAKNIDIDYRNPETEVTSLYFACEKNRLADAKFLVENGANPNAHACLIIRCFSMKNPEQNNMFIKKLEDSLRGDHKMRTTPFLAAVVRNFVEIVNFLLNQSYMPVTINTIHNTLSLANIISLSNDCVKLLADKYQLLEKQSLEIKAPRARKVAPG